jgi:hypothetical protein
MTDRAVLMRNNSFLALAWGLSECRSVKSNSSCEMSEESTDQEKDDYCN